MEDTMRSVLRSVVVPILAGIFTVACLPARQVAAELPPEILADRYLVKAEQLIAKNDYGAALKVMNKIVALQREHYLTLPDQFRFMYARVALSEGSVSIAIDSAKRYLSAAGTAGKFHKEALALLDEAEQMMLPLEPEMVVIPAGRFRMGCLSNCSEAMMDHAKPVHEVTIASFALSKYEVTFEEYARFTAATGRRPASDSGWGRGRRPVIEVSWEDAVAYTEWLSAHTGKRYRLPSEAEWEYAARAGTTTKYSWGNEVGRGRANCDGCGSQWDNKKTAPVGSFSPNAWGLHDMQGNIWEWVQDCWHANYEGAPADGSAWESDDCSVRVLRGGAWNFRPRNVRAAYRNWYSSDVRDYYNGFRVARTLE